MRICSDMLILDKGYIETRNRYIVPLAEYSVKYRNLKNTNIKNVLLTKTTNVERLDNKKYKFYFNQSDLFKGLLGDIYLFFIRSILQKNDFEKIEENLEFSANWNIVTNYYLSFYNASLLLRLCHRGNIFFDKENKKIIEHLISTLIGEIIVIDSNQFFSIQKEDGEYILILSQAEDNTHEVVWRKVDKLLNEILLLSNLKSEERTFLLSCQSVNRSLSSTFPSQLRNKINYQPVYGIECIDKKLYPIKRGDNWVKEIISFDINDVKNDINRVANVYTAYTTYIEKICYRLILDYFEMSGNNNSILTHINRFREKKIEIEDIPFVY